MSNSHLFLKSGFPRAPLQNGIGRYVCQLQRITLKFSKDSGSSRGMRNFLENELMEFANKNPGVVVYVKPRPNKTPVMVGEYLNGTREWINCANNTSEEISKWIELLRCQNGPSSSIRLRKLWHTEVPSIQGPWTPFTLKHPETNVVVFPNEEMSKPIDVEMSATEKLIKLYEERQNKSIGKSSEN